MPLRLPAEVGTPRLPHGLVSGRAHAIMLLERFIVHMKQHDVWFAALSDICDCWGDN
jgi:hypothetical protein